MARTNNKWSNEYSQVAVFENEDKNKSKCRKEKKWEERKGKKIEN